VRPSSATKADLPFSTIRGYRHDAAAVLFAFDLLELDGEDLRRTPIEERKRILAKLLSHPHGGIAFNEHHTGEGAIIFKHTSAHRRSRARPRKSRAGAAEPDDRA
jgi:ATP-dependent DNA ligase